MGVETEGWSLGRKEGVGEDRREPREGRMKRVGIMGIGKKEYGLKSSPCFVR